MYSFGIRVAEAKTKSNLGLLQQMAESHSTDNLVNYCDYTELFPNLLKYPNRSTCLGLTCVLRPGRDLACFGRILLALAVPAGWHLRTTTVSNQPWKPFGMFCTNSCFYASASAG